MKVAMNTDATDNHARAVAVLRRCHEVLVALRGQGHGCSEDLILDVEEVLTVDAADLEQELPDGLVRAGKSDGVFSGIQCARCGWWLRHGARAGWIGLGTPEETRCPICAAKEPTR